jgi:hypothetical protein
METSIRANVLGARRTTVDGKGYANFWISQEPDPDLDLNGAELFGLDIVKITCPHILLEKVKTWTFPGEYELLVSFKTSGTKPQMVAKDIRQLNTPTAKPSASVDKAKV